MDVFISILSLTIKRKGKTMYIDNHEVEVRGTKYDDKTNKQKKDQVLLVHKSTEGMQVKKLIPLLEEIAESHEAHQTISIKITMNQYDQD
jgi:hypothetical protein